MEDTLETIVGEPLDAEQPTPQRRSSRTSSGESSSSKTISPQKCIFCNKDKYLKKSKRRESLSSRMQIRADKKIRDIAMEQKGSSILAITSDELIAKEARYHFTCYREYTRPSTNTTFSKETESKAEFAKVIDYLVNLYEKSDVVRLSLLQDMLTTESGKKNLKRNIQSKTNDFNFVKYENSFLVYPNTLKLEQIVVKLYDTNKKIDRIEQISKQKKVKQSANIIREEIKKITYNMSWPSSPDELDMEHFENPPQLDLFLKTLFRVKDTADVTNRVSRLTSSFGQDITYAGKTLRAFFKEFYAT